ncbi:hypothetical protein BS78_03G094800 [Paspalum vaginatum]|nr:hypothetical protein BS78_03G094800 [Paspalum vaginatum]
MGDQQQQPQGMTSVGGGHQMPPGFRFYPSDEEIIAFYLTPKVLQRSFTCTAIAEVDLNKTEPWDLPGKAKIGEKEWYFFCQKDRKYPTGMRTNRATESGYWKATGKDKEIYHATPGIGMMPLLVGMKKTLVFYKGRAPRGDKTNWVMHEYRLEGNGRLPRYKSSSTSSASMASASKDEWVVCRVFHKTTRVKKSPSPSYAMSIAGIGSSGLQMNAALFRNPMVPPPPPMPFHHQHQTQMDAGAEVAGSFIAEPESGPSSMVLQKEAGMSPDQTSSAEISSMLSVAPACAATMDMDGIWNDVLKE